MNEVQIIPYAYGWAFSHRPSIQSAHVYIIYMYAVR